MSSRLTAESCVSNYRVTSDTVIRLVLYSPSHFSFLMGSESLFSAHNTVDLQKLVDVYMGMLYFFLGLQRP